MKTLSMAEFRQIVADTKGLTVPEQFDRIAKHGGSELRWDTAPIGQKSFWLDLLANAPSSILSH